MGTTFLWSKAFGRMAKSTYGLLNLEKHHGASSASALFHGRAMQGTSREAAKEEELPAQHQWERRAGYPEGHEGEPGLKAGNLGVEARMTATTTKCSTIFPRGNSPKSKVSHSTLEARGSKSWRRRSDRTTKSS